MRLAYAGESTMERRRVVKDEGREANESGNGASGFIDERLVRTSVGGGADGKAGIISGIVLA